MKFAFFSAMGGNPWGGSEELWAAAAQRALALGHQVDVSFPRWRPRPERIQRLMDAGAIVHERSRLKGKSTRFWADRLRACLPTAAPADVLCISQGTTYDFLVTNHPNTLDWLTYRQRVPYVVVCQYNDEFQINGTALRERARRFFQGAARVGFVAEHNLHLAERQLACALPQAIVVRNPVNLASTDFLPWPAAATARFCCVGRLQTRHKGQDVLFETLSRPPWRDRAWQLTLYGDGPERTYLQELARYLGIAERMCFAGHVTDLRQVWAENQILLLPSHGEGTPLALVEAMLCGRPAVVTDVGGNAEWIAEAQTGFVAAAATSQALHAALERAWAERGRWPEMGVAARAAALRLYDPAAADTLLSLMQAAAQIRSAESS